MSRPDVDLPIGLLELALGAVVLAVTLLCSDARPWGFAPEPRPPELCRSTDARAHRTLPLCPRPEPQPRKAGAQ